MLFKFYKPYTFFLQTKIKKTKSSYKSELKMSFSSPVLSLVICQYSEALNYLLLETKEGFIKWERCHHISAKL